MHAGMFDLMSFLKGKRMKNSHDQAPLSQDISGLYSEHLNRLLAQCAEFMPRLGADCLVISSGGADYFFEDDQAKPFRSTGTFAYFCPLEGPYHLIKIEPGKKPVLIRYAPVDFWHAQDPFPPIGKDGATLDWVTHFEIRSAADVASSYRELGTLPANTVFVGQDTRFAQTLGLVCNPHLLSSQFAWLRSFKSSYEIHCLAVANSIAVLGHRAAHQSFLNGGSEFDIYQSYLAATSQTESEMPYGAIIGVGNHASILHYQKKDRQRASVGSDVLLIDAGARFNQYGSDITRTYVAPLKGARDQSSTNPHTVFCELVAKVEAAQQAICQSVRPLGSFALLHRMMHVEVAKILLGCGIIKSGIDPQDDLAAQIVVHFVPHGIGHLLGIFVHDVAGFIASPMGEPITKVTKIPYLRSYRSLESGMVLTVEPGIYFIDSLLQKLKDNAALSGSIDWNLVTSLVPFGGVRIEDDVVVTQNGHRNLTREAFARLD
jgi:Xaa-Pro dipeptidase